MNQFKFVTLFNIFFITIICLSACKKDSSSQVTNDLLPVVQTVSYNKLLLNTVDFEGNVTDDHGSFVSKRGFCWSSTEANPTLLNLKTESGTGAGSFSAQLTHLKGQTSYHVRAYATNNYGTGYGSSFAITTVDSTVTDVDNHIYRVVQISNQIWMAENLKTVHLNDYTSIPSCNDNTTWSGLSTPAYSWYNNDAPAYADLYGAFYNWYTVNTGKLAPAGWHIPSDAEWSTLITNLRGNTVAGGQMKSTGTLQAGTGLWNAPNSGATDSSGFSGIPSGDRFSNGSFYDMGDYGNWWTSTEMNISSAYYYFLAYNNSGVSRNNDNKSSGFSVRCIRN